MCTFLSMAVLSDYMWRWTLCIRLACVLVKKIKYPFALHKFHTKTKTFSWIQSNPRFTHSATNWTSQHFYCKIFVPFGSIRFNSLKKRRAMLLCSARIYSLIFIWVFLCIIQSVFHVWRTQKRIASFNFNYAKSTLPACLLGNIILMWK